MQQTISYPASLIHYTVNQLSGSDYHELCSYMNVLSLLPLIDVGIKVNLAERRGESQILNKISDPMTGAQPAVPGTAHQSRPNLFVFSVN